MIRGFKRSFPVAVIMLLTHSGFILFTSGCQKNTPNPAPDAIINSQTATTSKVVFTNASVDLTAQSAWSTIEPELMVSLSGHEKRSNNIVAYRELRIAKAETNSGPLRMTNSVEMEQLTHSLLLANGTSYIDQNMNHVPAFGLSFQHPGPEANTLTRIQGTVTAITAGKTVEHAIPHMQNFRKQTTERTDWTKIFEIHDLPPAFAGDAPAIALTFKNDVIITEAAIINETQQKFAQTWTSYEWLPDGRSVLLIRTSEAALPESLGVKFVVNSELVEHHLPFDFNDLEIPSLATEGMTPPKSYYNSLINESAAAKGLTVQAHADWGKIPVEFPANGEEPNYPLEVYVDLFGANAANTVAVGKFNVESIIAKDELLTEIQNHSPYSVSTTTDFKYFDRLELLSLPPVNGVQATFQFDSASDAVAELKKFKGSVSLLTAKSYEYISIDNLMASLGETVHHPVLEAMQIQLKPVLYGDGLNASLDHDHTFKISKIIAVDASGSTSKSIFSSRLQSGKGTVFSFHAHDKLPRTIPVRIRVNHGVEEKRVRFEFEKIKVPHRSSSSTPADSKR